MSLAVPGTFTFNVNTTADIDTVNACATNSSVTSPPSTLSLREAVCIANNNGLSTVIINVPAGTYDLAISTFGGNGSASSSPELQVGIQNGNNISIVGAGANSTIIQQTVSGSRIIEADEELAGNMPLAISNLTLQNGNCTDSGLDCLDNGGGAILAGGATGDTLTLTNVNFNHNSATSAAGTMGGAVVYTGSSLTITGSTFSGNTASGTGGAEGGGVQAADVVNGSQVSGSVTITNSTFAGNSASSGNDGNADGGGLFFSGNGGFTGSVTSSTFAGNTASSTASTGAATGGGIIAEGGGTDSFSVSDSRIVGNSVSASNATASGFYGLDVDGTITNDWWGCNGGPGASGCDTVVFDQSGGGTSTFNPWLVLSVSANPTQINTGATSTLTADLTHNSLGTGGFSVPNGTPVTFGGTLDSSVNPTSTTLTSGQAASTYTAGSTSGTGSGTATVDNQEVSTTIDILVSVTVTTSPANLSITVDGVTATAPQTYSWVVGSSHTIATTSPQNVSGGTEQVFSSWSDGGAISHSVTAPGSSTTYTASFNTEYQFDHPSLPCWRWHHHADLGPILCLRRHHSCDSNCQRRLRLQQLDLHRRIVRLDHLGQHQLHHARRGHNRYGQLYPRDHSSHHHHQSCEPIGLGGWRLLCIHSLGRNLEPELEPHYRHHFAAIRRNRHPIRLLQLVRWRSDFAQHHCAFDAHDLHRQLRHAISVDHLGESHGWGHGFAHFRQLLQGRNCRAPDCHGQPRL